MSVYTHDRDAIDNAGLVIFISYGKENNAGSVWEVGYAVAKGIPVVMIKMTEEVESLMLYGSVTAIIMENEIESYDWKNIPAYKTKLAKLS